MIEGGLGLKNAETSSFDGSGSSWLELWRSFSETFLAVMFLMHRLGSNSKLILMTLSEGPSTVCGLNTYSDAEF